MVLHSKKEECCGCSACKSICPKSAIQMLPDDEGFLYPVIDDALCINCGMCEKVCAFRNGYTTENNFEEPFVYAVRHKDIREVETSRSGAMFIAVSDYILENNGVVYGVGYTDHFRVVHKRAETKLERNEFKGSKYVQSDINGTFELIKNDLQSGRLVLFSGTPCQTAGLYSYLEKVNTEKLYVCDIVCHGAPSPFVWRDYLTYIEAKYKDRITKVEFRDKQLGWTAHFESFLLKKKNKKVTKRTFTGLFYKHIMLRPSCGKCKYTNFKRPSDITLADYWGWQKISSDFNADDLGVSLVLLNTQKGKIVFEKVNKDINYLESCTTKCLQPNLQSPSKIPNVRVQFWDDFKKHGFVYIGKKYSDMGLISMLKKMMCFKKTWKKI
jgi:coenzyme F420-reducing hydrogenase beta subunit